MAKTPRLLSAEVVALGAQSVNDGGVAKDPLFPSGHGFDVEGLVGAKASAAEVGAGYIPYRHQTFIAERIELSIYLAAGRIARLPLPEPAREVLRLLARLKLALLLEAPLDLRAHCILAVDQREELPPELQDPQALLGELQDQLKECHRLGLLQAPPIPAFHLRLGAGKSKGKKAQASAKAQAKAEAVAGAVAKAEEKAEAKALAEAVA